MKYIIELFDGCWRASWDGDPGRTLVKDSAKEYKSELAAHCGLAYVRRVWPDRDFSAARLVKLIDTVNGD